MNKEVKILLRKGSVFILPIIAWICIVIVVDPFNYFNAISLNLYPGEVNEGDVNEDGLLNVLDVIELLNFILYGDQNNDSDGDNSGNSNNSNENLSFN